MRRDAETFRSKLGSLQGCGNAPDIIAQAVENKLITPDAPMSGPTPIPSPMNDWRI
jgi:hypothetical protein